MEDIKMKLRKIMAGIVATAVTASMAVCALPASAATNTLAKGEAIIGFGDSEWKVAAWGKGDDSDTIDSSYFTNAVITGNGTYTISVDLSKGYTPITNNEPWYDDETGEELVLDKALAIGAMGINVNFSADDEAYDNVYLEVTSIKFDGVETMKDGVSSYTNNEDGMKRTNIYNAWASYKAEDVCPTPDTANAVLTDFAGEWSKCEITFNVTGVPDETPADTQAPDDTDAPATEAPATTGDSTKPNTNTGVEGVAAVAGVALLAAGAVVVAKKRK